MHIKWPALVEVCILRMLLWFARNRPKWLHFRPNALHLDGEDYHLTGGCGYCYRRRKSTHYWWRWRRIASGVAAAAVRRAQRSAESDAGSSSQSGEAAELIRTSSKAVTVRAAAADLGKSANVESHVWSQKAVHELQYRKLQSW